MQITLLAIGKTKDTHLVSLIEDYFHRINRYCKFINKELPDVKNTASLNREALLEKESELLLKNIASTDTIVLLDSTGKQHTSETFANFIMQKQIANTRNLTFIIGGAFGFHSKIYNAFPEKCSLASLTFTHQMVRLIFCEQLYMAFTIINNEPYHHS